MEKDRKGDDAFAAPPAGRPLPELPDAPIMDSPAPGFVASTGPTDGPSSSHPPAIWFFFWGEFAERSSYYGMRTILMLYLTTALHMTADVAGPVYSAFKMACYLLPLLGGYIADRWLGRYWTIVGFSVPYVAGHFILGIPMWPALFIALALLAGGSGVIKPNISTLMGQTYDQKRPGQEQLRSAAFLWFYLAINIGALISSVAMPVIRDQYIKTNVSPEVRAEAEAKGEDILKIAPDDVRQRAFAIAFQFPAWLMVLSLAVFAAGKPFYAKEERDHRQLTPEERRLQRQTLWRLFSIFALIVLFWFGYEHNDSLWVDFTNKYVDLRVPFGLRLPFVGATIAPDQLQSLNALFVVLLVPTFTFLFGRLDPKMRIFTATRKILAGFLLTAAAVGLMSLAGFLVQWRPAEKVSVFWPAGAIIVLTFGEVLLYGTMLDLAYAAAPKSMKGFITACFLLTISVADFLNIPWTAMYGPIPPGPFFGITALVVVAAAVAFIFVGKQFERTQAEAAAAGVI